MDLPTRGIVRDATLADAETATRVLREVGLRMPETDAGARDHWKRLWQHNPTIAESKAPLSFGWVLEDEGRMVGFFGNVPLRYDWGDEAVLVGDASQWGVQPAYRAETDRLCQRYFEQPNVDLLLVTTGIRATGRIFARYGGTPLPLPHYDQIHYWILDGTGFLQAALRKKDLSTSAVQWLAQIGGPLVALGNIRAHVGRGVRAISVETITPQAIDATFDALWQHKRAERRRLMACRGAAWLRWHFANRPSSPDTFVLTARDSGLAGYAVAMRDDAPAVGLRRMKIADMIVADNDPTVTQALMRGVIDLAHMEKCHVVEFSSAPVELRPAIARLKPYHRQMPVWPAFYRARNAALEGPLAAEANWYVTPYDGDTTLV